MLLIPFAPIARKNAPSSSSAMPARRTSRAPPDIAAISDEAFEAFFFIRSNPKGLIAERWRHLHGCARFFNAIRDTVSDKFVTTYKAGEPKPDLSKLAAASDPAASGKRTPAESNRKPGANGES